MQLSRISSGTCTGGTPRDTAEGFAAAVNQVRVVLPVTQNQAQRPSPDTSTSPSSERASAARTMRQLGGLWTWGWQPWPATPRLPCYGPAWASWCASLRHITIAWRWQLLPAHPTSVSPVCAGLDWPARAPVAVGRASFCSCPLCSAPVLTQHWKAARCPAKRRCLAETGLSASRWSLQAPHQPMQASNAL